MAAATDRAGRPVKGGATIQAICFFQIFKSLPAIKPKRELPWFRLIPLGRWGPFLWDEAFDSPAYHHVCECVSDLLEK